jgi:hypothetical protein
MTCVVPVKKRVPKIEEIKGESDLNRRLFYRIAIMRFY